jgi:hypothetical protein
VNWQYQAQLGTLALASVSDAAAEDALTALAGLTDDQFSPELHARILSEAERYTTTIAARATALLLSRESEQQR